VETYSFSKSYKVALLALTIDRMLKMQLGYILGHILKFLAPNATKGLIGDSLLRRLRFKEEVKKFFFKNPIKVRRRLIRIIISYYKPLKNAIRDAGPELLMRTIWDSIIVYYKAYKLLESSFIYSGKFFIGVLYTRC